MTNTFGKQQCIECKQYVEDSLIEKGYCYNCRNNTLLKYTGIPEEQEKDIDLLEIGCINCNRLGTIIITDKWIYCSMCGFHLRRNTPLIDNWEKAQENKFWDDLKGND